VILRRIQRALPLDLIGPPQEGSPAMPQNDPLGRWRSSVISVTMALALICLGCVHAQEPARATTPQAALPRIEANRNLSSAGQMQEGVLRVRLEIREGDWYPEEQTAPSVVVQAFGEEGRALQIPGPMIRVPAGSEVRATVRNTLDKSSVKLYGLHERPAARGAAPRQPHPGRCRGSSPLRMRRPRSFVPVRRR
jgi:FtsP/CotA-like multicopper oxidase with cupredoxin domain